VVNEATEQEERILELNGTIADESWFDDDVTPAMFKSELMAGVGPITVYINSPGGDCMAASSIYNMLMEYKNKVTVKIDSLAASAASVIAMAGDTVLMAPTAMLMIHNPSMMAYGDHNDMNKAIDILEEVKESIINAYEIKTGMSRSKIGKLMEDETWMNAKKAIELGFADGYIEGVKVSDDAFLFSAKEFNKKLVNKINGPVEGRNVTQLLEKLMKERY